MDHLLLLLGVLLAHALALLAAGHALLHKSDSRSALGWVAVCMMVPVLGSILYLLFGIARVNSRAARLMGKAAKKVLGGLADLHGGFLSTQPPGAVPHDTLPEKFRHLAVPGRLITSRAVSGGNRITPLHNGELAYPAMLQAIRSARRRVYLSTFIFGRDQVGGEFAEALGDAARRGVDVRLLVDGVGAFPLFFPWTASSWKRMIQSGVRVARFLPPTLIPLQLSINLRTHRKVLVCDSTVGFTGGMNISTHHLAATTRPDRVQDLMFRCEGPIVVQLLVAFLMDWDFVVGDAAQTPLERPERRGDAYCRMLMDGPGSLDDPIPDLFCGMISSARHTVRIMTPYFLPPPALIGALTSAVLRGVTVDVILPGRNNHRMVDWAMQHMLPQLVRDGVHVYRQPPPFAHTKLMLIDDEYTLMGSANLDPRSLDLNFELVMEIFDASLNAELTAFYEQVRTRSLLLARHAPLPCLPVRLRNAGSWIFSPYL